MSVDAEQIYQNDHTAEQDTDDPNQCHFDLYIKVCFIFLTDLVLMADG